MLPKFMNNLPSQVVGDLKAFRKIRTKIMKLNCKIKFNTQCLKLNIIPNYAKRIINKRVTVNNTVKRKSSILWIKFEVRDAYKQKDFLNLRMYKLHLALSQALSPLMFSTALNTIDQKIDDMRKSIDNTHKKKINALVREQIDSPTEPSEQQHKFYPRFMNLTNIQFSSPEMTLLEKGLKYNLHPTLNDTNIKRIIADVRVAAKVAKLNKHDTYKIALKTKDILEKEKNKTVNNQEIALLKTINNKLTTHNSLITKADKGNTLVVITEAEYISKVTTFFQENNINQIYSDPLPKFQAKIRKLIDENVNLFSPKEKQQLKIMNPQIPKLRAQVKLHKQNWPIRPIVNNISCPSYYLNKKLNKILKEFYIFEKNFSIKNSYELVASIYDVQIPIGARFASLDIKNLYTNIPIAETINIIRQNFAHHKLLNYDEISEIIELLETTLDFNYFSFNNQIFLQKDGLAMGNSLAGTIADIFVNHIEILFFRNNPHIYEKIIYYKRYVDDTLLLFDGSEEELNDLNDALNHMHPNLKFTIEHEQQKAINFLDLTIFNNEGQHTFAIYRKPTMTDAIIHADSCHPNKYKRAFFYSMLHRMNKLPLSLEQKHKEISILKQIATANGYNTKMIDNLLQKIQSQQPVPNNKKYFSKTIYMGNVSDRINRLFKNTDITLAFSTTNSLSQKLKHTIGNTQNPFLRSGVYKLTCKDCHKVYIGQTGRNFKTRFKEHMVGTSRNKSVFGQHLNNEKHSECDIEHDMQILHTAPKGILLSTLEELEIFIYHRKNPSLLLNELLEFHDKTYFELFENIL